MRKLFIITTLIFLAGCQKEVIEEQCPRDVWKTENNAVLFIAPILCEGVKEDFPVYVSSADKGPDGFEGDKHFEKVAVFIDCGYQLGSGVKDPWGDPRQNYRVNVYSRTNTREQWFVKVTIKNPPKGEYKIYVYEKQ